MRRGRDNIKLSRGWSWKGEWYIEETKGDGWLYSLGFDRDFREENTKNNFVRKRKWIRKMILIKII